MSQNRLRTERCNRFCTCVKNFTESILVSLSILLEVAYIWLHNLNSIKHPAFIIRNRSKMNKIRVYLIRPTYCPKLRRTSKFATVHILQADSSFPHYCFGAARIKWYHNESSQSRFLNSFLTLPKKISEDTSLLPAAYPKISRLDTHFVILLSGMWLTALHWKWNKLQILDC